MSLTCDQSEPDSPSVCGYPLKQIIRAYINGFIRQYFDQKLYFRRYGHFLEKNLSEIVHRFAHPLRYPSGNPMINGVFGFSCASVMSVEDGYLYSAFEDCEITVWDLVSFTLIHQWKADHYEITCLACGSGMLASAGYFGVVSIWSDDDGNQLIRRLDAAKPFDTHINRMAFNRSGDRIVTGCIDKTIRIFSVENGKCLNVFCGHSRFISSVMFVNRDQSEIVVSGSHDSTLKVWNLRTGQIDGHTQLPYRSKLGYIHSVSINCDASLVVVAGTFTIVYSWPDLKMQTQYRFGSIMVCFHPLIPHLLAMDDRLHRTRVFDYLNRQCLYTFPAHDTRITQLCFTSDGQRLISQSKSGLAMCDVSGTHRFSMV